MSERIIILITGANGQLGMEFRALEKKYPQLQFTFASREQLAIENKQSVASFFDDHYFDYCVNCAAYTAVDKAESEMDMANAINGEAVGFLALACKRHLVKFIHISTDYVFDGNGNTPYTEMQKLAPVNAYGQTKLNGEIAAMNNHHETMIIRTSWVYSVYGKNFVKTMMRLMSEKPELNVVSDQMGCPTSAADLATAICEIIKNDSFLAGVYHYCNEGVISWFDFATAIRDLNQYNCIVHPIPTSAYPTPAKRPGYSALDTSLFKNTFQLTIPEWRMSLEKCISMMQA